MPTGRKVKRAGRLSDPPVDYPITRLLRLPDSLYQLKRVTSWMMRLEFSCTPVMR